MERHHVDRTRAFEMLRRVSMADNRKIRELAHALAAGSEAPSL
jgi:AmiR/NasT family two-component response regulator